MIADGGQALVQDLCGADRLSVHLRQNRILEVHCLDSRLDVPGDVRDTEMQIARLFGLQTSPANNGQQS